MLEMLDISKEFPGVKAIKKADFKVGYGEVHGLMGENGAGKSTLMKILTGIYSSDTGTILFDGKPVRPHSCLLYTSICRRRFLCNYYFQHGSAAD